MDSVTSIDVGPVVKSEVRGHHRQVKYLHKLREYPSSMIFAGPDGIGKKLVAKLYFELLNKGSRYGEQAIEDGDYGKFRVFVPDKGRRFTVDQVRGITHAAEDHPHPFKHQLIVLDGAEKLTFEAASALLKTLEDPPFGHARFVLLTTSANRMLPTVRSRSQTLNFFPLGLQEVSEVLQERGVEKADELAVMSGGSPGRALVFVGDRPRQIRNGLLSFFSTGPNMVIYSAFQFVDSIEAEFWPLVAVVLESLVVDLVAVKVCGKARFNTDLETEIKQRVQTSSELVGCLIQEITNYLQYASRSLNHRLQLKSLLFSNVCLAKGQRML